MSAPGTAPCPALLHRSSEVRWGGQSVTLLSELTPPNGTRLRRVSHAAQCSAYSWSLKAPEPTWADFMGTRLGRSPPLLDTGD